LLLLFLHGGILDNEDEWHDVISIIRLIARDWKKIKSHFKHRSSSSKEDITSSFSARSMM